MAFQQYPAFVIYFGQIVDQFGVGVIGAVELTNVAGITEILFDQVEIVLKALPVQVLFVAVPAYLGIAVVGIVHDLADIG
ncbi:hypothetical protein D3C86_2090990 [compost metagenome]